jgi:hypothetical protein
MVRMPKFISSGGPVMAKWFVPPIVIPAAFIVMVVVMALLRLSF